MSEVIESAVEATDVGTEAVDATESIDGTTEESSGEANELIAEAGVEDEVADIKEAIQEGASEKKVQSMIKKLTLKIDGQEVEREIDISNEAELVKMMQMAEVSQKRMQESSELRKADIKKNADMEDFLAALKNNPKEVLEYLGHDVNKFAENVLEDEVKKMELSPEERKIQELHS